ncbi:VOC family protein [Antrihabitans stalactiti]|uniref:VOC family protein n=1 Tax=Antrihabitans stalactiti TaxID=2584121 RepID=A0A848KE58_9NOCA|nr:VOC family protein [Antrihabitans stalactiti]
MSIVAGPIYQVAWVVEDIETSERVFTEQLGVMRWNRMPNVAFTPETASYRGQPADYVIHVSLGYLGDQQIELIQPVSGTNLYTEFLDRNGGGGLHHTAWLVDNLVETLKIAAAADIPVNQQGDFGEEMKFAYLDFSAGGAPYVELMQLGPNMRAFFDSMCAASKASV